MLFQRNIKLGIEQALLRGRSILLLGPRQSGKTTVVKKIEHDLYINLMNLPLYYKYSQNPGLFSKEVRGLFEKLGRKPIIIIDEVQMMPELTNSCQVLIDEGEAVFIITSSSARKIRNLLPGRVALFKLSAMLYTEYGKERSLIDIMNNGFLPGVCNLDDQNEIEALLEDYVAIYLEEEIRKEALVRNLTVFSNFLRLACIESGNIINFTAISQELGITAKTVQEYYRILEDCLIVRHIEPLVKQSTGRRRLTKGARYIFFDLGLRRVGAKEGIFPSKTEQGRLLEQFVGIELSTLLENNARRARLLFWRDHNGPEVDFIIEKEGKYIPIEVKLTKRPSDKDIKNLKLFRLEYPVEKCYLVANIDFSYEIEEGIEVIPWNQMDKVIESLG